LGMQCPRCHAENRDGLTLCEDRGARLAAWAECGASPEAPEKLSSWMRARREARVGVRLAQAEARLGR
jgi:hypothetical protein